MRPACWHPVLDRRGSPESSDDRFRGLQQPTHRRPRRALNPLTGDLVPALGGRRRPRVGPRAGPGMGWRCLTSPHGTACPSRQTREPHYPVAERTAVQSRRASTPLQPTRPDGLDPGRPDRHPATIVITVYRGENTCSSSSSSPSSCCSPSGRSACTTASSSCATSCRRHGARSTLSSSVATT